MVGIQHLYGVDRFGYGSPGIIADPGAVSRFSSFGRDHDHSVSPSGAVDGCGGGVFQYRESFNVFRVQKVEGVAACLETTRVDAGVVNRYTVNDIKRFVVGVYRSSASDANRGLPARLPAVGRDLNPGYLSGDQLVRRNNGPPVKAFVTDRIYCTGGVVFLYCTITNNDYFFQYFNVFSQLEIERNFLAICHHHGLCEVGVSGVRSHQLLFSRGNILKNVVAVKIGCRTSAGTYQQDGGADQRLAIVICRHTFNSALCKSLAGQHEHYG